MKNKDMLKINQKGCGEHIHAFLLAADLLIVYLDSKQIIDKNARSGLVILECIVYCLRVVQPVRVTLWLLTFAWILRNKCA